MFRRFYQYIREQPRSVRDSYAFFGAIFSTVMIATVWLVSGSFTIAPTSPATQSQEVAYETNHAEESSARPFHGFVRGMQAQFGSIWHATKDLWGEESSSSAAGSDADAAASTPGASRQESPQTASESETAATSSSARIIRIATSSPATTTESR